MHWKIIWSLTFTGERHLLQQRSTSSTTPIDRASACAPISLMPNSAPGTMVADITAAAAEYALDGSASVTIEALMVAEV
jgi:hypothetical protein